jgi:hypothetical protein
MRTCDKCFSLPFLLLLLVFFFFFSIGFGGEREKHEPVAQRKMPWMIMFHLRTKKGANIRKLWMAALGT